MTNFAGHHADIGSVERAWARLGVLLNVRPADETPDIERLLLATAQRLPENARLFDLVVTWLVGYSHFVARHRLARLVADELAEEHHPALALLLASAIERGATRDLAIVADVCRPAAPARPLFIVLQGSDVLERIAKEHASALSKRWGVWAPDATLKDDAIRPAIWLLAKNPTLYGRIVRKGDLRVSILETLRRDADGGSVRSESKLARLAGANRSAVRKALAALVLEGEVTVGEGARNDRDHPVALRGAA